MLTAMAEIFKSAMEAGLILVLLISGLSKAGINKQKPAIFLGTFGAAVLAITLVYWMEFFGDREIFEGYLSLAVSITTGWYGLWIWRRFRNQGRYQEPSTAKKQILLTLMVTFTALILTIGKMTEIVMFPSSIFLMSSNLLNSEVIVKMAGVLLGLAVTAAFVFILIRMEQRISHKEFLFFSSAVLLVIIFRQVITGLQVLFAVGTLPLTTWAVNIIAPLINTYYPMFFYTLVGLTVALWGWLGRKLKNNYPDTSASVNPAQKRKLLAGFHTEKRWLKALGFCLFSVTLILGGNIALANKGVKIEPPTPVSAQGSNVLIPLEQISDGKLHRFSYTAQNVEIRFVVIKKGENLFGTGLDACDICGKAGYYQRGKDVVCKNCDVVINIPTIGFPGGCNPIPIKNQTDDSNLVISIADLELKQEVFRD